MYSLQHSDLGRLKARGCGGRGKILNELLEYRTHTRNTQWWMLGMCSEVVVVSVRYPKSSFQSRKHLHPASSLATPPGVKPGTKADFHLPSSQIIIQVGLPI